MPLDSKSAQGWISNAVTTHKNWNDKKTSVNLDTRPMTSVVKRSHFPNFLGSDHFPVLDLNLAFHQFELDEESLCFIVKTSVCVSWS